MRTLHRRLAPWLFALVAVSAVTGVAYRTGRAWFGLEREAGNRLLDVHVGAWIHPGAPPFYVLLVGGGLLFLLLSGTRLLLARGGSGGARRAHRGLGLVLLLPLAASAVSGILFQLGEDWFGFSKETRRLLMTIHEGRWLGDAGRPVYVALLGVGLLALGAFGLRLGRPSRRPRAG